MLQCIANPPLRRPPFTSVCATLAQQVLERRGAAAAVASSCTRLLHRPASMVIRIRASADQEKVADGEGEHGQLLQRQAALRCQGPGRSTRQRQSPPAMAHPALRRESCQMAAVPQERHSSIGVSRRSAAQSREHQWVGESFTYHVFCPFVHAVHTGNKGRFRRSSGTFGNWMACGLVEFDKAGDMSK